MYEHVKTGCKHISPSEQPLQFQSRYYLNKPRKEQLRVSALDNSHIQVERMKQLSKQLYSTYVGCIPTHKSSIAAY